MMCEGPCWLPDHLMMLAYTDSYSGGWWDYSGVFLSEDRQDLLVSAYEEWDAICWWEREILHAPVNPDLV